MNSPTPPPTERAKKKRPLLKRVQHTPTPREKRKAASRRLHELCLFSMFGALMFASKIALEWAPNIHLLGVFTMLFTVVYRQKALIPIFVYVMIGLVYYGFQPWFVLHFYVWPILWALTMLIPRRLPKWAKAFLFPLLCGLHGLSFGALCAISQVPLYYRTWSLEAMLTYTAVGFKHDITHAIGNAALGLFILPLSMLLEKLNRKYIH